jgi:uncharacterized protein
LNPETFASRLRDVVRAGRSTAAGCSEALEVRVGDAPQGPRYVVDEIGGGLAGTAGCTLVDRVYEAGLRHGTQAVGDYAELVSTNADALAVLTGGGVPPDPGGLLFFDIETTGLSGGAGTYAFLVGLGHFDAGGFRTRQYFMSGFDAEHALLADVCAAARGSSGLVSFNGSTFDVPVLEVRYLFHRMGSPFGGLSHLDMLHVARRVWRDQRREGRRAASAGAWSEPQGGCSLGALERDVLSVHRDGDVPGFEIPARYFHFIRTGDAEPLAQVFEHNRIDLLSLAALTALALRLVAGGPAAARNAWENVALGRIYERAGRIDCAAAAFERASCMRDGAATDEARVLALGWLARFWRRKKRYGQAADAWARIVEIEGCGSALGREAVEALAIHHEHRAKDPAGARLFALRALQGGPEGARREAVEHRLARLDRKLKRAPLL